MIHFLSVYFIHVILVIPFILHSKSECKEVSSIPNIFGTIENEDWDFAPNLFKQNFIDELDLGASLAIYHNGKLVVNLCGGWFDQEKTKPYKDDTLQLILSTSKGIVAIAVALCVQNGLIDYNEHVTKYWPEYGQNGKENTTVADIMSHSAGLPELVGSFTLEQVLNWTMVVNTLEKQKPLWKPGTKHVFHGFTFGWLAGELVRRVDLKHRTFGQFIQDEIIKRTETEFYIGLPSEYEYRVSPFIEKKSNTSKVVVQIGNNSNPLSQRSVFNDVRVHQAEIPAVNGITNAKSLARIYASLIGNLQDGQQRLLNEDILKQATKFAASEDYGDPIFLNPTVSVAMGFTLYGQYVLGDGSFGHSGTGGGLAFALPEKNLSFAYVLNQLDVSSSYPVPVDLRVQRILDGISSMFNKTILNGEKQN